MQAETPLPTSQTGATALQPSNILERMLAYVEDICADELGLDCLLDLAVLCWKTGLAHEASRLFDRALVKAKGFRYDFRRGSSLVACASAFRQCGMTTKAQDTLEEATAVYAAGSPELFVRGLLMQLVAEYAESGQWERALSLTLSCPDSETRNEAVRIVVIEMARRGLWSEALGVFRKYFPRGHSARARALVRLASLALEASAPESEQRAIIAELDQRPVQSA